VYLEVLDGSRAAAKLSSSSSGAGGDAVFCSTLRAMQTMEAVAAAIHHREPLLLTGETGTGKTSLVQHLASRVGAKMVVVNLNQQTDSSDLLGGFKPVEVRQLAQELLEELMALLPRVTSKSKNSVFLQSCRDKLEAQKWKVLAKLLAQASALVESLITAGKGGAGGGVTDTGEGGGGSAEAAKGGKRKNSEEEGVGGGGREGGGGGRSVSPQVRRMWRVFATRVGEFTRKVMPYADACWRMLAYAGVC
jgi:midasin